MSIKKDELEIQPEVIEPVKDTSLIDSESRVVELSEIELEQVAGGGGLGILPPPNASC